MYFMILVKFMNGSVSLTDCETFSQLENVVSKWSTNDDVFSFEVIIRRKGQRDAIA